MEEGGTSFHYEGERAEGVKEGMRSMAAKPKGERKWGRVWRKRRELGGSWPAKHHGRQGHAVGRQRTTPTRVVRSRGRGVPTRDCGRKDWLVGQTGGVGPSNSAGPRFKLI
jgi:hypothetical protein